MKKDKSENIRKIGFHESVLIILYMWYLTYPDLSRIPYYDFIDDLIFSLLIVITLYKILKKEQSFNIEGTFTLLFASLFIITFSSYLYNDTSTILFIKFFYVISRPFLLLIYISKVNPDIELIFRKIFRLNKFILLYNLPLLIYSITINSKSFFANFGHVSASVGMFPFSNTDTLSTILAIFFINGIYNYFVLKKSNLLILLLEFLLLLTTMNIKYITVIMLSLIVFVVMFLKKLYGKMFGILIIILIPILLIAPKIYQSRFVSIPHSPVFIVSGMIISGVIEEHSMFFGTGPGTFTSNIGLSSESELAEKYGLLELKEYFERRKKMGYISGTLTRMTSSVLTLFGDIGLAGLIIHLTLLLIMIHKCWRNRYSREYFLSYVFGFLAIGLGVFLETWYWGIELYFLILAYGNSLQNHNRGNQRD